MSPKKKQESDYEETEPSDVSLEEEPASEEEYSPKKKKKAPAARKRAAPKPKKAAAGSDGEEGEGAGAAKPPAKKRAKPAAKITVPTERENGWVLHPPSLIYKADPRAQGGSRVACFDLDGTLVGVKSGAQFPRDAEDWKWFSRQVPEVLQQCHEDGYQILIISNQGGIKGALDGAASAKARGRVDSMLAALAKKAKAEIPAQVVMATQKDENRKPGTGMWRFFVQRLNKGVEPDLGECFYVGDMAGRSTDVGDGQASDKEFAAAVGLKFFLPEDKFGEPDIKKDMGGGPGGSPLPSSGLNGPMASAFNQLADLLADNHFKANAFRKVAEIIEGFPEKITAAAQLKAVKGVGKSSLAKITEFLETGTLAALTEAGVGAGGAGAPVNENAAVGLKFI